MHSIYSFNIAGSRKEFTFKIFRAFKSIRHLINWNWDIPVYHRLTMVSTSGWSDRWRSAHRYKSNVYSTQGWAQILSKILPHILRYIFFWSGRCCQNWENLVRWHIWLLNQSLWNTLGKGFRIIFSPGDFSLTLQHFFFPLLLFLFSFIHFWWLS